MHGAKNLNPVITLKNLLRRTYCPQAGGRCSVTGWLWPFPDRDGETGSATRLSRKIGEQHRLLARVGNAERVFGECRRALAIASASLPKTASSEVVLGRPPLWPALLEARSNWRSGRHSNLVETAWRPRVPGVGGRSRAKSKTRARRRGYGVLARDEDAGHGPPGGSGLPAGRLVQLLPGGERGVGALRMSRPVLGTAEQMGDEREPE